MSGLVPEMNSSRAHSSVRGVLSPPQQREVQGPNNVPRSRQLALGRLENWRFHCFSQVSVLEPLLPTPQYPSGKLRLEEGRASATHAWVLVSCFSVLTRLVLTAVQAVGTSRSLQVGTGAQSEPTHLPTERLKAFVWHQQGT